MAKRYDLCTGSNYQDNQGQEKTKWTKIGSMVENNKGGFTIFLDALPLTPTIQVFEPKPRENNQGGGNF